MRIRTPFAVAIPLLIAQLAVVPVFAQSTIEGQSAEEISKIFLNQKTRGLVLVPSTETATTTATTVTPPVEYVELSKEEQVNVSITFDFDSAALRDDQKPKLATLCEAMQSIDIPLFRIVGHTDASGPASYNDRLSLLRAQEVKRYLVGDCGISEDRLEAVGVGERFPFDSENPNADENRRVEFQAMG